MSIDLYCKIYINGNTAKDSLVFNIAQILNGQIEMRTISTTNCVIDVFENKEKNQSHSPDDFVYSPFYLEIDSSAANTVTFQSFTAEVAVLMSTLQQQGFQVTASCDFEDDLTKMILDLAK